MLLSYPRRGGFSRNGKSTLKSLKSFHCAQRPSVSLVPVAGVWPRLAAATPLYSSHLHANNHLATTDHGSIRQGCGQAIVVRLPQ